MFHTSKERNGIRPWWHFGRESRSCVGVEFYWWSPRFGVSAGTDDDGWNLSLRLPPLALYVSLESRRLWRPMVKHIFTWDNNREVWLPERREFDFYVADWSVRFTPWGRWGEWRAADPWWIRGVSLDIRELVLGQRVYEAEELALVPCSVPMPEGQYAAVAKVQRVTRGFARWFKRTGNEVTLTIPNGIPFAGKGENSWDCGDDGLFSIGGYSVDDAIRCAQASAMESRRRHGHASDDTVREALG
jgi:hypothetical protein